MGIDRRGYRDRREYHRNWSSKNRDRRNGYQRNWSSKNRERSREYQREYRLKQAKEKSWLTAIRQMKNSMVRELESGHPPSIKRCLSLIRQLSRGLTRQTKLVESSRKSRKR